MVLTKEDLKNKAIKINNNDEWIKIQLILFSYGIAWKDTGLDIFRPESTGYNIFINENCKITCYHGCNFYYNYKDIEKM